MKRIFTECNFRLFLFGTLLLTGFFDIAEAKPTCSLAVTEKVDHLGGKIALPEANFDGAHIAIIIPRSAFETASTIEVKSCDSTLKIAQTMPFKKMFSIAILPNHMLDASLIVSVRLNDGLWAQNRLMPIPFFVDANGERNVVQLITFKPENNLFAFAVNREGTYSWAFIPY